MEGRGEDAMMEVSNRLHFLLGFLVAHVYNVGIACRREAEEQELMKQNPKKHEKDKVKRRGHRERERE